MNEQTVSKMSINDTTEDDDLTPELDSENDDEDRQSLAQILQKLSDCNRMTIFPSKSNSLPIFQCVSFHVNMALTNFVNG